MNAGGSIWVTTDSTEPIEIQIFGQDGIPLPGKIDIVIQLRRISDSLYLDWTDNTLKLPAAVVQRHQILSEVSATYSPGLYRLNSLDHPNGLHLDRIINRGTNDIYDVTILQAGGTDAVGLPLGFEMKVGFLADNIASISSMPTDIADAVWDALQADHTVAHSFGDMMRRIVALQKENYFIDEMTYNTQGLLLTGRIRLFTTRTEALAATDGGAGEGEFATYSFDTTPVSGKPERPLTARSVRDA
jgi:hypothetical protein